MQFMLDACMVWQRRTALQLDSGPHLGVRLKALAGGLPGLAMNVAVVAFGPPGVCRRAMLTYEERDVYC